MAKRKSSVYQSEEVFGEKQSAELCDRLTAFLAELLIRLDAQVDKRLVRTFLRTIIVILLFRHRQYGLLLSELGGYILPPDQAPAGTKRLSNLLRSEKWGSELIVNYLWEQADQREVELRLAGEDGLVVWDESELEKPESIALEGLSPVRSSRAARLKRIKPGYYNPPGGRPIFVPGMHWIGLLLMGRSGPPTVATMRWWRSRGPEASDKRTEEKALLKQVAQRWKGQVIHVWDRGFAGEPWLTEVAQSPELRFVLRWPKGYKLTDTNGNSQLAWKICQGKRSLDFRLLRDARRNELRKYGLYYTPVSHPAYPRPLFLVVARPGQGHSPWYLLTNEPLSNHDHAWRIILAYARRWQIEMAFRYTKSELAFESPRLWLWDNRLKLLFLATLAYAFLLSLLNPHCLDLRTQLLQHWCHRTGKRCNQAATPLYRLRSAIARLWLAFDPGHPHLDFLYSSPKQNSG